MIVVHHLNDSRSQRILWLLEELQLPYEIKRYQRDARTRLAPPELKAVHPLGKSPVITDDGRVVAESGAIVDYIIRRHGGGRLQPEPASAAYDDYVQWLHFAEGSAMLPLLLKLYTARRGHPAPSAHHERDREPFGLHQQPARGPGLRVRWGIERSRHRAKLRGGIGDAPERLLRLPASRGVGAAVSRSASL
jgi:glutathione S-transferase